MKKMITLLTAIFLMGWTVNVWAFTCTTASGVSIGGGTTGGTVNVNVNLTPTINVGQNLVVDLSTQIFCHNDYPESHDDMVSLANGHFSGGLSGFTGTVKYDGRIYPFPTSGETNVVHYNSKVDVPWPTVLYLTPMSSAGGVVITAGSPIATLDLHERNNFGEEIYFTWVIIANNNVVVPTGGCDVSARDVTVTLPDYPGTKPIPLTVHCAQNQKLAYYLSGATADSANSIFTNTASTSVAQGIGVQMTHNGSIVPANSTVSLGTVGTSPVNLGLTATYARTKGQVTAGNVQSIIGVIFVYE